MAGKLDLSYAKGTTDIPLLERTIGEQFNQTVAKFGDSLGIVVRHQAIRWTYSQYGREVDKLAVGLMRLGIKKGDRVGIWAPNCIEWSLTQFATAKIGAILVCLNPAYRVFELEYAIEKSGCKAIVSAESFETSDYLAMLNQLLPELSSQSGTNINSRRFPELSHIIRLGAETTAGMLNFDDLCVDPSASEHDSLNQISASLTADEPINIQFTSGTTGSPKGATLTHRNILNNGNYVGGYMKLTSKDRLCIPVPLYHCFGMVMGNLACVSNGAAAIFPNQKFDAQVTLETVEEEKCTALHGVPTMFIAELSLSNFSEFDLSSLRTGIMAGAPCPVEIMKQVQSKMHMAEVLIAYGQTECSPVNLMTAPNDVLEKRISTVGRSTPNLEIKIAGEDGNPLPVGKQGEICCRGYAVMSGYWRDDEQTKATIDKEGWLHSGDLGIMDQDSYVKITGRIKDMIIRGGENVYPREIEEFVHTHSEILEAQVFGVPDPKFGEAICAWIKTQPKSKLTEDDIKDFCKGNISHFKIPKYVQIVPEFPMTVTGKPQKFIMRDRAIEMLKIEA